jgi:16S rRNA (cytosine967-C5)-methyltransferase
MSVSATDQRAARIIERVTPELPADAVLREALSGRETLEPSEKRAVARLVFAYYRWLGWLDAREALPRRLAAARELQARFDREPGSFKSEALLARAVPGWVAGEIAPVPEAWLRKLQHEPALWIRAQAAFARALPRALGACTAADLGLFGVALADRPPTALRYDGPTDLFRTDEFRQGLFEIQDLASQLVGYACDPRPGETWWDACAGEGGKTLHLGDLMNNRGLIWCSDRSPRRLATLRKRAARARLFNYRAVNWNGGPFLPTKTRFDGILVDAPCSGVGTWQRNPHARWTTSAEDVRELAGLQLQLLEHVAPAVKPGGKLVYAVCTLTRSETTAIADAFSSRHPEFAPLPVLAGAPTRFLWPQDLDANGMFVAAWTRNPA